MLVILGDNIVYYVTFIENTHNEILILVKHWLYNGNMCNEMPREIMNLL